MIWVFSEIFSPLGTLSPVSFFVSQCVYVCLGSICVCVCVLGRSCVRRRSCYALKLLCLFLTAASNSSHVYARAHRCVCEHVVTCVDVYTVCLNCCVITERIQYWQSNRKHVFFFWLAASVDVFSSDPIHSRIQINFIAREIFFYSKLSLCSL